MACGAVYVAYGPRAREQYEQAAHSLQASNPGLPITAFPDAGDQVLGPMHGYTDVQKSRWAKVNLDVLSPYEQTVYLDADTRVTGDISAGFELLGAGFDLALTFSKQQGARVLWHCSPADREDTFNTIGTWHVLQYQCGVLFFARNPRVGDFFAAWRNEWLRHKGQDQAAFLRALERQPLRIWLFGRPWNGGTLIRHLFGKAR